MIASPSHLGAGRETEGTLKHWCTCAGCSCGTCWRRQLVPELQRTGRGAGAEAGMGSQRAGGIDFYLKLSSLLQNISIELIALNCWFHLIVTRLHIWGGLAWVWCGNNQKGSRPWEECCHQLCLMVMTLILHQELCIIHFTSLDDTDPIPTIPQTLLCPEANPCLRGTLATPEITHR